IRKLHFCILLLLLLLLLLVISFKKTSSELSKLLLAPPNSPLQYPIQGFTVPPLRRCPIPGTHLTAPQVSTSPDQVHGDSLSDGKAELTVESSSLKLLNAVLASVSYQSSFYHVHTADLGRSPNHSPLTLVHLYEFNVKLFKLSYSQVSITIKTFLRYDNLKELLSSIRRFYPNITVIIADDSIEPEKITGENIHQYIMPPAQGWFAGRNLAVSQVTTKYFLWADDDFIFSQSTKIEKMVEVMEAVPELDVVGGSVQGNTFHFSLEYDKGDETEGGCLYRKSHGRFHAIPGYPQCYLTSGVVNFFLARTDCIQKSRFDPLLKRVAHSEFFMDGLGSLMVASCSHVSIGHQPKKNSNQYNKFRKPTGGSEQAFKYQLHFFKNNLKCIKFG
uniref:Glycosyltransferase 2-like domain-containing protein n=1 Tax=Periophthalmus magnuspinnatus TaxID=409849 RepID=A0A3B3ZD90_9GOBI